MNTDIYLLRSYRHRYVNAWVGSYIPVCLNVYVCICLCIILSLLRLPFSFRPSGDIPLPLCYTPRLSCIHVCFPPLSSLILFDRLPLYLFIDLIIYLFLCLLFVFLVAVWPHHASERECGRLRSDSLLYCQLTSGAVVLYLTCLCLRPFFLYLCFCLSSSHRSSEERRADKEWVVVWCMYT